MRTKTAVCTINYFTVFVALLRHAWHDVWLVICLPPAGFCVIC